MKDFHWCDFEWDCRTFPDPAAMLSRLKERGLHICVWINPYIAQRSRLFEEGMRNGYLLKKGDGSVWQTDEWQPGMGMVDFTNPDACRWFAEKLRSLLYIGVDCFKTDFGERIPLDAAYYDGSDPVKMHNYYTYLYNKTVWDLLVECRGEGEAALFARSATAGCQQFPVHWGGDCHSTFESMAESLRGGLSLCLSGFGFWSHDIGGFEGTPPVEIYKRWAAFGLLSSHSRLHGSSSYRVPWVYDDEAVDVLRFFTKLKCSLMPYLYAKACDAHQKGLPMIRAMMLEFPDDPTCDTLDRQYMLGDSLLAAPVFSSDGMVQYYVPEGTWTNYLSGEKVQRPGWVREKHGYTSLPLLVKPGAVIPAGKLNHRPDYDYSDGVTFQVYELPSGKEAAAVVPTLQGETALRFSISRNESQILARLDGASPDWKIFLAGVSNVSGVQGGSAQTGSLGTIITPDAGAKNLQITLG
jgi:alpha-D-xyloside xylohydrolase